jgi:hypothetical protein
MLADRLGRSDAVTNDRPYTLQVPPTSRQISMRKLIAVGLFSVHDRMNKDQRKPKGQNAHSDPRQEEKRPNSLEHTMVRGAVTARDYRVGDRSARR